MIDAIKEFAWRHDNFMFALKIITVVAVVVAVTALIFESSYHQRLADAVVAKTECQKNGGTFNQGQNDSHVIYWCSYPNGGR